jgi:hypothetical protein
MSTRTVKSLDDFYRHGFDIDLECKCGHTAVVRKFMEKDWSTSLMGGFLDSPFRHFKCSVCGSRPTRIGPVPR